MMIQNEYVYDVVGRLRDKTICCDFSFLRRDLCVLEFVQFVEHYLHQLPEVVERLQWNTFERRLYVRVADWYEARRIVQRHSGRHLYPDGPEGQFVKITLVDQPTEVLLFDLSELVEPDAVRDVLEQYGVVMSVATNAWGTGTPFSMAESGHLLVRMVMRSPVPAELWIQGERSSVIYAGQQCEPASHWVRFLTAFRHTYRQLRRTINRFTH